MFRKIKNVVGVSLILMVAFLLLIAFFEYKFDTYYYDKEDCVEATVIQVQKIRDSGRYTYNVVVEYTTPKGDVKQDTITKAPIKLTRIGKKTIVGCKENGDAKIVKRDWLTWKYIDKNDKTNGMFVASVCVLIVGLICFLLIPNAHGMIVAGIMTVAGIAIYTYSGIHSGALQTVIKSIGFGLVAIAVLLFYVQWRVIRREKTDINFGPQSVYEPAKEKVVEKGKKRVGIFGWIKKGVVSFSHILKRIENVRSSYWAVLCFVIASVLAVSSVYLIWGRGEYSGYKCAEGIVIEVDEINTYEDNEIIKTEYAATVEYLTDTGEKRTYTTEYIFKKYDNGARTGDKLLVGYRDELATLLEKNMYTGKYEAYDKYSIGWLMLADMFFLIGIYMITKNASIRTKKIMRAIGWILFGMLFEFSFIVSSGEDKIVYGRAIPTLIGVIKLILAVVWIIKERKISQNNEDIEYNKRISEIRARKSMFEYKKKN